MATALITGASSGIGAATAQLFALKNYDLLLLGRNLERLKATQVKCLNLNSQIKVEILSLDLKNYVSSTVLEKIKFLSPVEILVNNAGLYINQSFEKTSDQIWEEQFQVNLMGAIKLTRDLWPLFKKNNKGSILNVSSTLGLKPAQNTSAYSAIKAAMINWTLTLAQEGGQYNIRANCVCPGIVDTPIHQFHTLPSAEKSDIEKSLAQLQLLSKLGTPEQVAESIYFLASDLSAWTTGAVLSIDGGINIK